LYPCGFVLFGTIPTNVNDHFYVKSKMFIGDGVGDDCVLDKTALPISIAGLVVSASW
jgi:hypothetical protein